MRIKNKYLLLNIYLLIRDSLQYPLSLKISVK